jgi:hypothetical protein
LVDVGSIPYVDASTDWDIGLLPNGTWIAYPMDANTQHNTIFQHIILVIQLGGTSLVVPCQHTTSTLCTTLLLGTPLPSFTSQQAHYAPPFYLELQWPVLPAIRTILEFHVECNAYLHIKFMFWHVTDCVNNTISSPWQALQLPDK